MSGFGSLEIGKKALLTSRFGLDVTSNNIANVNSPNYSRRAAVIAEDISVRRNGFFMGNSAIVQKIQSFRSDYYDREIRGNKSKQSSFDIESQFLKRVETVFGEPSIDTIDSMVTDFFKSFDQATLNPDNYAFRSYIVDKGVALAERFNSTAAKLNDLRGETLRNLDPTVKTVNTILQDISDYNKLASFNANPGGDSSQQFADQRELKLQELSKYLDVKVASNDDNTINIFVNGINLVSGVYISKIDYKIQNDPVTNEATAILIKRDIDSGAETVLEPQSGEVYSNLKIYNEILDPLDSSGKFSIAGQFNEFVSTFATKINDIMVTGFGMNDNDPLNPPNRHFFEPYDSSSPAPSSGINAALIKVNSSLISNPRNLQLSGIAGEPNNTDIARAIARLSDDKFMPGTLTPVEYYAGLISKVGNAAKTAMDGLSTSKLVDEQLNTQRESLMGVNLDEEAINLIKFQKGFEAASRVISITNELLSTLINLGK